jgi:hypothetical protein
MDISCSSSLDPSTIRPSTFTNALNEFSSKFGWTVRFIWVRVSSKISLELFVIEKLTLPIRRLYCCSRNVYFLDELTLLLFSPIRN